MLGKRLQILKAAVPNGTGVAIVYDPTDQLGFSPPMKGLEESPSLLRVQLQYVKA